MNLVYLAPDFPNNFQDFSRALHEVGVQVLGIGQPAREALPPALQGWLTDYYQVDSLENYDQLHRACGTFISRHGRLDRVESHTEYWLQTEARLREDFNIWGMRPPDMEWVKRKSRMKERFRSAGVPVARGRLCSTVEEALELVREVGYPLVGKPDIGVGAAGTYKLKDEAAVRELFSRPLPTEYFFEEYLHGTLCSFDGLTNRAGEPVFQMHHIFSSGIMEVVNEGADVWYYSEREIPAELVEYGRRVLRAFDVWERFFHLEFFRTENGFKILEANLRVPGGITANMFCYANNVDIFRQWAQVVARDGFDAVCDRPYYVFYVGRRNSRQYKVDDPEAKARLGDLLAMYHVNEPIFSAAIGDRAFVLRHDRLQPLQEAAGWLLET